MKLVKVRQHVGSSQLRLATQEEMQLIRGGRGFWDVVKSIGRWVKKHLTRGPGDVGVAVKGTHDIGGGGGKH